MPEIKIILHDGVVVEVLGMMDSSPGKKSFTPMSRLNPLTLTCFSNERQCGGDCFGV